MGQLNHLLRRPARLPGASNRVSDRGGDSRASGSDTSTSSDGDGQGITLITTDALHTQTTHVEAMNAAGLDWMPRPRATSPPSKTRSAPTTGSPFPPQHITDETGHGRHDVRVIRAAPASEQIKARWPGAGQMFLIERYRHQRTKAMGDISLCTAGPAAARTLRGTCSPAPGSSARKCPARLSPGSSV